VGRGGTRPLAGKKVLVTRAAHQAGEFSALLRRLGARPVIFPLIRIEPLKSPALDRFLGRFREGELKYDYAVFTSRNGIDDFFRRAGGTVPGRRALQRTSVVAIGPGTAASLRRRGVKLHMMPEKYVAESLAEALGGSVKGKRVLLLRARGARETLPHRLRRMGATVTVRSLYQALPCEGKSRELRRLLSEVDFVTVASSSTVRSLAAAICDSRKPGHELLRAAMRNTKLASIGPVTSRTARRLGLHVDVEAKEYTMPGLAGAIAEYVKSAQ
jgi:uroporphyrinogen III methyltransferase/synthase